MSSFTGLVDELGELTLFLQERMQLYDSGVDTSEGSTFYNTVIKPLIERVGPDPYNTPLRTFIISRLKTEFPDLVLQDGEPLDDYAVKIMQVLIEPFRRQIQQVSNNQSLANPAILNEREADKLAANYFVPRRQGGFSVGIARLYFSAPQASLITPNNMVYDGAGQKFIPVENQAISNSDMLFNGEGTLYYQDIVCRAELEGDSYNIEPNTLVGIEGAASVVKVTNKSAFEEGGNKETTEMYVERVQSSLTEKSLVTFRGINARLLEVFTNIRLLQVIGHGDPEMMRDILTGTVDTPAPYAFFLANTGGGGDTVTLTSPTASILEVDGTVLDTFVQAGARIGDKIRYVKVSAPSSISEHTITAVGTNTLTVTPDVASGITGGNFQLYEPAAGITISDIPGGILDPSGEIRINNNEVHLGGMVDVFVRSGNPQRRDINLTGILDGQPLHFGIDLETFGDEDDTYIQVTDVNLNGALRPNKDRFQISAVTNHLLIQCREEVSPGYLKANWIPTEEDVGRFIQLLSPSPSGQALLKITGVLDTEYTTLSGTLTMAVRITVEESVPGSAVNYEKPATPYTLGAANAFDTSFRVVEKISVKSRVRDRDGSRVADAIPSPIIPTGVDFADKGAEIGDSVVLETGDDAGIYSVRRLLSWMDDNDTFLLDRALTRTVTPSGLGDGSGIRYRIADELNVDLVAPKVVKIPLGTIFLGDDLSTVAGSSLVSSGGTTNFLLAGVSVGDTLEILEGDSQGKYSITEVAGLTLKLNTTTRNTESGVGFSVYRAFSGVERPLVRVKDVELLDSNSQPTGIKIPYGDCIDARALGIFSNRAEGTTFESYTGITRAGGGGLYELHDPEVSFVAEGVVPGHRLNIVSIENSGEYTVVAVGSGDGLADDNTLRVAITVSGGLPFPTASSDNHYTIGLPSTGVVRLYFLEPTSVEVETGLTGGRLQFNDQEAVREFRFSEVPGRPLIPAAGSGEVVARDLRVARIVQSTPPNFFTVLELTGLDRPNVYELEIQNGDVLDINEPMAFRTVKVLSPDYGWAGSTTVTVGNTSGVKVGYYIKLNTDGQYFRIVTVNTNVSVIIENPESLVIPTGSGASNSSANLTLREAGVFGKPAGLKTIAGSNLVEVPPNSLVDFQAMDVIYPLAGQLIYIDTGADAGQYVIESVVSSKKLRISQVMTSTTESWIGVELTAPYRDAQLIASGSPVGSKTDILDSTDAGGLGSTEDEYITIFESNRGDLEGTYKIEQYVSAGRLQLDVSFTQPGSTYPDIDPNGVGPFSWLHTRLKTTVWQEFRIYRDSPTQVEVQTVGTKRADILPIVYRGSVTVSTRLTAAGVFVGVSAGDQVEVLTGPNRGVYPIASVDGADNYIDIVNNPTHRFSVTMSDNPFRVWSGLHGSLRMLTVQKFESSNGRIEPGDRIPYRVLRPKTYRLSSTDMQNNFDGLFYYVDLQVESQGSGDAFNLAENSRLTVESGLRADGYTYTVDNTVLTFSPYEQVFLNFDRRFLPVGNSDSPENLSEVSGRNLKISYETSSITRLVNDLMTSETERPVNANPLARHFLPSYVFTRLTYRGGASADVVGADVENYLNGLGGQSELEVSDLETFISRRGANSINHPIFLATVTHDLSRNLVVDRTENRLGGAMIVPYNGTGRISCFFAKLGEGLTVEKQS